MGDELDGVDGVEGVDGVDHLGARTAPSSIDRILPWAIATVAAAAHAIAWRSGGLRTWIELGGAQAVMALAAAGAMHRSKRLFSSFRPVSGDVAAGAMAGAAALVGTYAVATLAFRLRPESASLDLLAMIRVVRVVESATVRSVGLIGFALLEELVWRGAVTGAFSARMSPARAALLTTLLATACAAGSGHPAIVLATLILGGSCAVARATTGRLLPAIFAHAMFSWFAVTWLIPELYAQILPTK